MQSSYELRFARAMDARRTPWTKNWRQFDYEYAGRSRRYTPDFYLPETDEFVEVKGFKTPQDEAKWTQFPGRLRVVFEADIVALESSGR